MNPQFPTSGLPTELMGEGGTTLNAPGGSGSFSLGPQAIPEGTNWSGALQGGASALGGLYNLYGGATSGDPLGAGAGAVQAIGGMTSILQNSPELAGALGLDSAGGALGGVAGAAGGLGGLFSLYQGIQSGNPMQIGTGVLGAIQGGMSLYGTITGTTAPGILTGLATVAPETMAGVASALSGTTVAASAGSEAIAAAISGAAAAYALPVAAVVQIITDTIAETERERMQNAGFVNNPIKGALYSASTAGTKNINDIYAKMAAGGGLAGMSTSDLGTILASGMNNLMPYYATAQGGRGAIRASDTLTGGHGTTSDKALPGGDIAGYTQNAQNAQQSLIDTVNELLKRGVTYEQLGQLPVSGDWADNALDANNPLNALYAANAGKYDTEGQQFLNSALTRTAPQQYQNDGNWLTLPEQLSIAGFGNTQAQDLTMQNLFTAAQGQAGTPGSKAQQLVSDMYGGPLWGALARQLSPTWGNVAPGSLQEMIQQHFDPWAGVRGQWSANPSSVGTSLMPVLQRQMVQRGEAYQTYSGPAAPEYTQPQSTTPNYWDQLGQQQAQQNDPVTQQLMQYMQQLQQLQGQLPQLTQAAGQMPTQGLDPQLMAAMQPAGFSGGNGAFSPTGGGGVDLQALLRQLGYIAA